MLGATITSALAAILWAVDAVFASARTTRFVSAAQRATRTAARIPNAAAGARLRSLACVARVSIARLRDRTTCAAVAVIIIAAGKQCENDQQRSELARIHCELR